MLDRLKVSDFLSCRRLSFSTPFAHAPHPTPPSTHALQGGQFRQLNEQLYSQTSSESFKMMKKEPRLFEVVRAPPLAPRPLFPSRAFLCSSLSSTTRATAPRSPAGP